MGRVFLLVLLLLTVVIVQPDLRAMATPYAEAALDPIYRRYAAWRLAAISDILEAEIRNGRAPPTHETFTPFVERAFLSEGAARDPWGTPYFLKVEPFSIRAASAGRDRKAGTDEDIVGRPVVTGRYR